MTHRRTEIRNALKTALTGMATCGSRVYASRLHPLQPNEVPAILVSTGAEAGDHDINSGLPILRELDVRIEIVVKAASGYEDIADTVLDEIETRLFDTIDHNTLSGLSIATTWIRVAEPEFDDSTEKPVVRLPLHLTVSWSG